MKLMTSVNTEAFAAIVNVIAACGGDAVLLFTEDELSVCVSQSLNQVGLWISCSVQYIFSKYTIMSAKDNTILLKCNPQQLARALNIENAPTVKMNLSKRNKEVVLNFEYCSTDTTKQLMQCVNVTILKNDSNPFEEPAWEPATISTQFPPIKAVINWTNEMKDINNLVTVSATKEGCVSFRVESDCVTVKTTFEDLELPEATELAAVDEAEALVDIKKLKRILKIGSLQGAVGELHLYDKNKIRMCFTVPSTVPDQPTTLTYVLNATTKSN